MTMRRDRCAYLTEDSHINDLALSRAARGRIPPSAGTRRARTRPPGVGSNARLGRCSEAGQHPGPLKDGDLTSTPKYLPWNS